MSVQAQQPISPAAQAQIDEQSLSAKRDQFTKAFLREKSQAHYRENLLKDMIIERETSISRTVSLLLVIALMALSVLLILYRRLRHLNDELLIARDKALVAEKAKTNFLAVMSHEIRTPLNAIIPVAELLKAEPRYQEDKGLLSLIAASGDSLLQMLDNILIVSEHTMRPEVQLEPLNLIEISKPILRNFAVKARCNNLKLEANVARGFPQLVATDKASIENILRNLLSNAVKFTPPDNEIKVCFDFDTDTGGVSISIRDKGIGISVDNISSYLEPFTQKETGKKRGYEGVGIGLSVVNLEVERLGGSIVFITDHPVGTEVLVKFPNLSSQALVADFTAEHAA